MNKRLVIIGAGPAGLSVAYDLYKQKELDKYEIIIVDSGSEVGGISKTLEYKKYKFDLGGHRFYTDIPIIKSLYEEVLGSKMMKVKRSSRIYFEKKYFNYPLKIKNVLKNLGFSRSISIITSYIKRQVFPIKPEKSFYDWVSNRFGGEIYQSFFAAYTYKVVGISPKILSSDWAKQRIQNFSLLQAVLNSIFGKIFIHKTVDDEFLYPQNGPGQFYSQIKSKLVKNNVKFIFNSKVTGIKHRNNSISKISLIDLESAKTCFLDCDIVVSTMPLTQLIKPFIKKSSLKNLMSKLKFRSFIEVCLLCDKNISKDQWIYIHDKNVKACRLQNYRNWSPHMIPKNGNLTPIGVEYFTSPSDKLWKMTDQELIVLAKNELVSIGLCDLRELRDGFVVREKYAYPLYLKNYLDALSKIKIILSEFKNLHVCGRGGLFQYIPMDLAIFTGVLVSRNIAAKSSIYDPWEINNKVKEYSHEVH